MKHLPAESTFSSSEPSRLHNKLGVNSIRLADWVKMSEEHIDDCVCICWFKGCHQCSKTRWAC